VRIQQFQSKLLEVKDLTSDTKEFVFTAPEAFTFIPGQFVTILFDKDGKQRKQYSIVSPPEEKNLVLCIKFEGGVGSEFMWALKPGEEVHMMAPLGVFYVKDEYKDGNLFFIATGTGVAPFVSIVKDFLKNHHKKQMTLIAGYRKNPLYHDELSLLANQYDNFTYHVTITEPLEDWKGNVGRVQALLDDLPGEGHFYICGLWEMIDGVLEKLKEKGIPQEHLHFERYD